MGNLEKGAASSAYDVDEDDAAIQLTSDDEYKELPGCPVCLNDILDLREKCVVTPCMHVFCVSCLKTWVNLKRVCPLCKGRIQSYMYDIQTEASYQEHVIPPSPEPQIYSLIGEPIVPQRSLHGSGGLLQNSAQQSSSRRRPGIGSAAAGSSQAAGARAVRQSHQMGLRAGASITAARQQAEPRPYFWRVQQRLAAGLHHTANSEPGMASSSSPSTSDQLVQWRRSIYSQGLWSKPIVVPSRHSSRSSQSNMARPTFPSRTTDCNWESLRSGREKVLESWVDRELCALLQVEDTTLVRSFVIALLRSFGFQKEAVLNHDLQDHGISSRGVSTSSRQAALGSDARNASEGPVLALTRFLFEHAAHFWHEVSSFALSGLSITAWDSCVQYESRQDQLPHSTPVVDVHALTSAATATAALISAAGRFSEQPGIQSAAVSHRDFIEETVDMVSPVEQHRHPRLPVNQQDHRQALQDSDLLLVNSSWETAQRSGPSMHRQMPGDSGSLIQERLRDTSLLVSTPVDPLVDRPQGNPSASQIGNPMPRLQHSRPSVGMDDARTAYVPRASNNDEGSREERVNDSKRSTQSRRTSRHDLKKRERSRPRSKLPICLQDNQGDPRQRSFTGTHVHRRSKQVHHVHRHAHSRDDEDRIVRMSRSDHQHLGHSSSWASAGEDRWQLEGHAPVTDVREMDRHDNQSRTSRHYRGINKFHREDWVSSRNLDRLAYLQKDDRDRCHKRLRKTDTSSAHDHGSCNMYYPQQSQVVDINDRWQPEDFESGFM